ncbi:Actin-related protein 2/3 complex subunit 4 [Smittium culicis]|uniref:Actin-related protein 2/3 complex subunit 4 n=1 Tax=Smittium culicis TaxID=133412 RepID=A0A1R1YIS6_9FUNG|nr:Actin-related protein 2/3 complex subunit 4 [Smittium culicis]
MGTSVASPELVLNPLLISRTPGEQLLLETSANSCRISLRIKQADDIEKILCHKLARFLMLRSDSFQILRRTPIPNFDLSFLVTYHTITQYDKTRVVDFIIEFLEQVDKEISEMKLSLNARARIVAESYLSQLLLETSANSCRISLRIKQADDIEKILCHKLARFLMLRSDSFQILRRTPIPNFDLSFLVTYHTITQYDKTRVVDFIIEFLEQVDKEISEMKLSLNARARIVAESYLSQVTLTFFFIFPYLAFPFTFFCTRNFSNSFPNPLFFLSIRI